MNVRFAFLCFIIAIIPSTNIFGQLNASYFIKEGVCNCINVSVHNQSSDTIYVWSQSRSIHYWDSCFAYTIYTRDAPQKGHVLDMTSYYMDYDYHPHNTLYIFPDSTLAFGARRNDEMISDSLLVSMYVYAMPIKKGESMEYMQRELRKFEKSKTVRPWGWRNFYCPREQHGGNAQE